MPYKISTAPAMAMASGMAPAEEEAEAFFLWLAGFLGAAALAGALLWLASACGAPAKGISAGWSEAVGRACPPRPGGNFPMTMARSTNTAMPRGGEIRKNTMGSQTGISGPEPGAFPAPGC